MKLSKLKLYGFKSFAKATLFEFSEGISAIVGPNGCGKSNIIDAFRWVMGEISARAIRGDKMLDVIFSGSGTKKAMNFAEVTLTFSEASEFFKLDFDEVALTRRVHRSGESEFFINQRPVRLKDIESLFWDTGLGKSAFCIFEQGKIDEIIISPPEQRRQIFEEAAGINRFKMRRKEALKRLEGVDSNIERLNDICYEVEKSVQTLSQQAIDAKEFKQDQLSLELLEKGLFKLKKEQLHLSLQDLQSKEQEVSAKIAAIDADIMQSQQILKQSEEEIFLFQNESKEEETNFHHIQSRLQVALAMQKAEEEKLTFQKSEKENAQSQFQKLKKALEELQAQEQSLFQEKEKTLNCYQNSQERWQRTSAELLKIQQSIDEQQGELSLLQRQLMQIMADESKNKTLLQEKFFKKTKGQERLAQVEQEQKTLTLQRKTLKADSEAKKQEIQTQTAQIALEQGQLKKFNEDIAHIKQELKIANELKKEKSEALGAKKAQLEVLCKLRDEMQGASLATKQLVKESSNMKSALYGVVKPLYEEIKMDTQAEKSITAMMKTYSQTLLVKTKKEAALVLQYSKTANLTDFSLFCSEDIKEENLTEYFLQNQKPVDSVKELWLKKGTLLADQWHVDKTIDFVDPKGVFFAGASSESSPFTRKKQIKDLEAASLELQRELEELNKRLDILSQQHQVLTENKDKVEWSVRKKEMKLVEVNFLLQQLQMEENKLETKEIDLEREKKRLSIEINECLDDMTIQEKQCVSIQKKVESAKENIAEKEIHVRTNCRERDLFQAQSLKQQEEYRQAQNNKIELEKAVMVLQAQKKENSGLQELLLKAELSASQLEQESERLKMERGVLIKDLQIELDLVQKKVEAMQKRDAGKKQEHQKQSSHIQQLQKSFKHFFEKKHQLQIQIAAQERSLQVLQEHLTHQFQLDFQDLDNLPLSLTNIAEMEALSLNIRAKLAKADMINLSAIEEYESTKERRDFLIQQIEDLNNAKIELLQMVAKLEEESRDLLAEVFYRVRRHFQTNFQTLFQGGEADLSFTEGDILQAGVEIKASPPGKQMRSINLLSGGEKCLTAMALLFALFNEKPAAFCLLDEIDAPLDEANVDRLLRMLKEFTSKTQFIVITHNKRTMQMADHLFGVTMEEKGISSVMALKGRSGQSLEVALLSN